MVPEDVLQQTGGGWLFEAGPESDDLSSLTKEGVTFVFCALPDLEGIVEVDDLVCKLVLAPPVLQHDGVAELDILVEEPQVLQLQDACYQAGKTVHNLPLSP